MKLDRKPLLKAVDSSVGPLLCSLLGAAASSARHGSPPDPILPDKVRRMLIIRPGGIGDMIVLLPVLQQVRSLLPRVEMDLVCETRNMAVLRLAGLDSCAMPYDARPFRFLSRLRRCRYDIVIDTEQFHHFSAVFGAMSGAPVRIGFKINPRRNPLYSHLVDYSVSGPEGRQFARLFEPLGVDPAACALEGCLANGDTDRLLRARGVPRALPPDGRFVAVHPGASTRYKEWVPDRFAGVAMALSRECDLTPVLIGGRRDRGNCTHIADSIERSGGRAAAVVVPDDLIGAASVLTKARLFIGVDSGLAHLAVALGRPTVVLFGPSDHRKWGTESRAHAVVREAVPCAPCFIFGYHKPCRTIACMRGIRGESVLEACRRVLRGSA